MVRCYPRNDKHGADYRFHNALAFFDSGAVQNSLFDMAGGEEKFLNKNLLAPYAIIAKIQQPRHPFLKNVSVLYSLITDAM